MQVATAVANFVLVFVKNAESFIRNAENRAIFDMSYRRKKPAYQRLTKGSSAAIVLLVVGSLLSGIASGADDCLLQAQSYYEQIYCEVKRKGKGRALPSFIEFKNNNEMTQALLLKRDAQSLRLDLKMPSRTSMQSATKNNAPRRPSVAAANLSPSYQTTSRCLLKGAAIQCDGGMFKLQGNRKNNVLDPDALSKHNRLVLKSFTGNKADTQAYESFLLEAYIAYLNSMRSIGLAGVTMSYGRFSFLMNDLESKGVDAQARFAKMFEYLKQDKQRNAVSEIPRAPSTLTLNECAQINHELFVCGHQRRNYLFVREQG